MSILFLSFPYIPFGGQGHMVRDLAFGLKASFHSLTLICLDEGGDKVLDFPGEKIVLAPGFKEYRSYWRQSKNKGKFSLFFAGLTLFPRWITTAIKLAYTLILSSQNHEVLMGHGQYESAWIGAMGWIFPKKRTIGVIHASIAGYLSRFERSILLPFYRRLSCIVVLSEAEKDHFIHLGIKKENIRVIPNGIEINRILRLARESLDDRVKRFIGSDPYIVSIGRLCPQKDQGNLIQAFMKVRANYKNCKLILVGNGELLDEIAIFIEENHLYESVYLVGALENPYPILAGSICHVLASRYEGFGLVHAEALLLGVPVIASDVPTGPREILSGSACPKDCFLETAYGILVPKESSDILAQAIEYLFEHIDRFRSKAAFGSKTVQKKYDQKMMIEAYDKVCTKNNLTN